MPEYHFHVPPELAPPEAKFWRAMGVSTHAAWFILSVRPREPKALLDTFLLAWDSDVAEAITSLDAEVESLLIVASQVGGRRQGWFSKEIREIWEAIDPADEGNPCLLLVAEDGQEYAGLFMERAAGLTRDRLVARIQSTSASRDREAIP